jgi:hypothetical protein
MGLKDTSIMQSTWHLMFAKHYYSGMSTFKSFFMLDFASKVIRKLSHF